MRVIFPAELPRLLTEISTRGARPVGVYLETFHDTLKKNRETQEPHTFGASIRKLQKLSCFLNFEYERSVNRQRDREGIPPPPFQSEPNWFYHVNECRALLEYDGKQYVQLKVERSVWKRFFCMDGREVSWIDVRDVMKKPSDPVKQGVESPIITITPAVESILAFICDGETYCIGCEYNLERLGERAEMVTA